MTHFPAGMKLGVSYHYCPLETLADKPLFNTVLEGLRFYQKTRDSEAHHIAGLNDQIAAQQQAIAALQQQISELHQKNAEAETRRQAYETSLEGVLNSSSWRLTRPLRRLLGLFRH